jgi:Xaa-Pro dipeptidase
MFNERIFLLKDNLRQKKSITKYIIFRPGNIFYFTGFETKQPALLLMSEDYNFLVLAESDYSEKSIKFEGNVIQYKDYSLVQKPEMLENGLDKTKGVLKDFNKRKYIIGCDSDILPLYLCKKLDEVQIANIEKDILLQRSIKQEEELQIIKNNISILDDVMKNIEIALQKSTVVKEIDLFNLSFNIIVEKNMGPFVWEGCLGSGIRTNNCDVLPIDKIIENGEQVLVDLFPSLQGYYGDITRTFVRGTPSSRQREIYLVLKEALQLAEKMLKPGVKAAVIDKDIRDFISKEGYGDYFCHHSGHGLGIDAPELPLLFPWSRDVINQGNIICIEPGIYIPSWGGMRIEQAYYIAEDGPISLSEYPFEI